METKAKSIDRQCKEHLAQQGITSMETLQPWEINLKQCRFIYS
jgi:hypothetical protein